MHKAGSRVQTASQTDVPKLDPQSYDQVKKVMESVVALKDEYSSIFDVDQCAGLKPSVQEAVDEDVRINYSPNPNTLER